MACDTTAVSCLSNDGVVHSASDLADAVSGVVCYSVRDGRGPDTGAAYATALSSIATTLAGAQVTFDGVPAPLLYVQTNQVNAIVPDDEAGKSNTGRRAGAIRRGWFPV